MPLINVSVYCALERRTIIPWRITSMEDPNTTLREFFVYHLLPSIAESDQFAVEAVFVGKDRQSLDEADANLNLVQVTTQFGSYIKYIVKTQNAANAVSIPSTTAPLPINAFEIMMDSQKKLAMQTLPSRVDNVKNRKDKLRNDVIDLLDQNNLSLKHSEVSSEGEQLIQALVNTLWYVDAHHETMKHQACEIPAVFHCFVGYNVPEISKHRKRVAGNMSSQILHQHSKQLFICLQASYWDRSTWKPFRGDIEMLAKSLSNYANYLDGKNKHMKEIHAHEVIKEVGDNLTFLFLPIARRASSAFHSLEQALQAKGYYQSVQLVDFAPDEPQKRHEYTSKLKNYGLSFPTAMLIYSHGNNVGNLSFIWQVEAKDKDSFSFSQDVIESIRCMLPVYTTRARRKAAFKRFGRLTTGINSVAFHYMYKELTGDQSGAINCDQSELEKRVKMFIDMEDADIIVDLRHFNSSSKGKYDIFWEECSRFIQEGIGQAVDDRRHQEVTHLATAMSVPDLISEISKQCPEGCPIPSESWVRLQFWPKNHHWHSACHYTCKLNIKYMIQTRQLRQSHEDSHYAAAVFRYQREMGTKFRAHSAFICLDDKHRIPIGEPGYPVAAVERGKRVMVAKDQQFMVADHDFTRFSLVPSVSLFIDIPEDITDSWYQGQVRVTLKEASMQPSSAFRHAAELILGIEQEYSVVPPMLFLYTDGGPDHRLTFLSVQATLISVFLALDLDFLCVCRTAPHQSWKNPVERVMSILNLGLQSVGMMRKECSLEAEESLKNCNSLQQIRSAVIQLPSLADEIADSIEPAKLLIADRFQRLGLKGKQIKIGASATEAQMQRLNMAIQSLQESIDLNNKIKKVMMKNLHQLKAFMDHCCHTRHYQFSIKKCGKPNCKICRAPRLPQDVFENVHMLPDPIPGQDDHYLPFTELYGTQTTEGNRPSLTKKSKKQKTLPFVASIQHARNVNMVVQCEECGMWRLIYSKKKLTSQNKKELERKLSGFDFSCGSSIADLHLCDDELADVHFRDLRCEDPVEKLYYSMGFEQICVYCSSVDDLNVPDKCYPICGSCSVSKQPMTK